MDIDFGTLVPFALITLFTPGPNTILAATMGVRFGYRRTLPLLLGIWTGFFLVFAVCMMLAATLLRTIEQFERIISVVGAIYILYLAYRTFKLSYELKGDEQDPLRFSNGLLLQLINPKVIIFGLTLFSTFLSGIPKNPASYVIAPAAFASLSLASTTTWALAGTAIASLMHSAVTVRIVNSVLSLSLVWIAINLSGVLTLM